MMTGPLFAGDEDIVISAGPWRTNVCYQMGNYWYGAEHIPISSDGVYFAGYENPSFTYPKTMIDPGDPLPNSACAGTVGRGWVYGLVSDLAGHGTADQLAAYNLLIKPLPVTTNGSTPTSPVIPLAFSNVAGQESIIFVSFSDGTVKSADLSQVTPTWIDRCDWSDIGAAYTGSDSGTAINGFDQNGFLVGNYGGRLFTPFKPVKCDVSAIPGVESAAAAYWSPPTGCELACTADPDNAALVVYNDLELNGTGHMQKPLDSDQYATTYGNGTNCTGVLKLINQPNCPLELDGSPFIADSVWGGHADWKYDADWFVTDLFGSTGATAPFLCPKCGAAQYYFTRSDVDPPGTFTEVRRFLTHPTAGAWVEGSTTHNYHSIILGGINHSGNRYAYTATDGKYTYADYLFDNNLIDWEPGASMWIAEITIGVPPLPPAVTTANVTAIEATTATGGGDVTDEGGGNVSDCGVAWSTTIDPTVADSHTHDSCSELGVYSSSITGLQPCMVYYVRAWVINETATEVYGDNIAIHTVGECIAGDWTAGGSTIALVASESAGGGGAGGATTAAIDTTGATLIVVGVSTGHDVTAVVTDNKTSSWTELTSSTNGYVKTQLFYSANPNVGAGHTFNATQWVSSIYVLAFSGATITTPFDQQNGANGIGPTLPTGSVTPTVDKEVVVTALGFDTDGFPLSIDNGFTKQEELEFSSGNYRGGAIAYKVQTTAAAVNPTWTRTNTQSMATRIATFKPTAADYYYMTTSVTPYSVHDGATLLTHEAGTCPDDLNDNEWCWIDATDRLYVQTDGTNPGTITIKCGVSAPSSLMMTGIGQ
jgi:hypothetical protein